MAVRPDGRVVTVRDLHNTRRANDGFVVEGLRPNGRPDGSFGVRRGRVRVRVPPLKAIVVVGAHLDPEGRTLVVAATGQVVTGSSAGTVVITRLARNGRPDPAFGFGGVAISPIGAPGAGATVTASVVMADRSILAAGDLDGALALHRYTPDGLPDRSFGAAGAVVVPPLGPATALAAQPDGKVVVTDGRNIARLLPDGQLDPAFATGGVIRNAGPRVNVVRLITDQRLGFSSLAVQPDGKVVAAGSGYRNWRRRVDVVVRRFDSDGSSDLRFGKRGGVVTNVEGDDHVSRVLLQPGGKIVVAATSITAYIPNTRGVRYRGPTDKRVLLRYRRDGRLDRGFGRRGRMIFRRTWAYTRAAEIWRNRLIVGGGLYSGPGLISRHGLARRHPAGSLAGGEHRAGADM